MVLTLLATWPMREERPRDASEMRSRAWSAIDNKSPIKAIDQRTAAVSRTDLKFCSRVIQRSSGAHGEQRSLSIEKLYLAHNFCAIVEKMQILFRALCNRALRTNLS